MNQGEAVHFVNEMFKHCKPIAAMTEGIDLLRASSIKGVNLSQQGTCGQILSDKGVITVCGPADVAAFSAEFVKAIAKHRHWDRDMKEQVPG